MNQAESVKHVELRVAALAAAAGKLLLVNHEKRGESYWVLPGGRVEFGETLAEALAREMREELSVEADIRELVLVRDFIEGKRHVVEHVFRVECASRDFRAKPDDVLRGARWTPLAELDGIDLRPAIADTYRRLASHRRPDNIYVGRA
jgi:ADP-ribose pyrophosphatase YjhB (NUDIX family)